VQECCFDLLTVDDATTIYVHCAETIWSKCLVTRPSRKRTPQHVWEKRGNCVRVCVRSRMRACVCVKRACTTRGREPIKSNAIVVTIPLCFSMLFPGKPQKPKNTISIQSRSIHGSEMIKIYYDFNNFLYNLKSALF